MEELLGKIAHCVEIGKINKTTPYPAQLVGQDGVEELTKQALDKGLSPDDILYKACVKGMHNIGEKFRLKQVYVPQLLIAARAMTNVMNQLKPFFASGQIKTKGTFVIGTVAGDLHDIGKNLVSMVIRGAAWQVVDLGVDVANEKFLMAIEENPDCVVGLSALLTTTMVNMQETVAVIKNKYPQTRIMVGGAPLSEDFAREINADFYSPEPQGAVEYLNKLGDNGNS